MSTRKNSSTNQEPVTTNTTQKNTENTMSTMSTTNTIEPSQNPAPAPAAAPPVVFVSGPPANAVIPSDPAGFTPQKGGFAPGTKPRKAELAAAPGAMTELQGMVDYTAILGQTVPPQAEVVQLLDASAQWSIMRGETRSWGLYCANEEGVAWTGMRQMMARLGPAFQLAVTGNPSLATKYPKLTALLGAKKAIARKTASTKSANKKVVAAGKPATHGAVGKKNQRAAEKAALAAAQAAQAHAVTSPPATAPHTEQAPAAPSANGPTTGAPHS